MLLKGIPKVLDVLNSRYNTPVTKPIREKVLTSRKVDDIAIEEFQEQDSVILIILISNMTDDIVS